MSRTINELNTTDTLAGDDKLVIWKDQAGATRAITAADAAAYFSLSGGPYQPLDELLTAIAGQGPNTANGDFIQLTAQDTVRVRKLTVATYAALTVIPASFRFDDMLVYVASRTTDGDGGEGWWRFDAASSATANSVTILAPDAGTGRWIAQVDGPLSAGRFGAIGNDSADNATAFALMNTFATSAGRVSIAFPAGVFRTSAEVAFSADNVSLIGAGAATTIISQTTASAKIINSTGDGFSMRGVGLIYSGTPTSGAVSARFEGANPTVSNVVSYKSWDGFEFTTGGGATVSDFQVLNYLNRGLYVHDVSDCYFVNGLVNAGTNPAVDSGSAIGIAMNDYASAIEMVNVNVLTGRFSIVTDATSVTETTIPAYSAFTNCYFDAAARGSTINKMWSTVFTNCWFSGGRTGAGFNGVTVENCESVSFIGCRIVNNGGSGVYLRASSTFTKFVGCDIQDNAQTDTGARGILIESGTEQFIITGCDIRNGLYSGGAQTFGIVFSGSNNNYVITDNNLAGNVTGAVFGAAFGPTRRWANNLGYVTANVTSGSVADGGTIAHGLGGTPSVAFAQASVSDEFVSVTAIGASNLTLAIKKNDGTTGTTQTVYVQAML